MDHDETSDPFAGLGVNPPSGSEVSRPRRREHRPLRRRGPVSREVAFHLARAERPSRVRSVLELFVDGLADLAADLHADGRLPQVQTQDGPLQGRTKS